jgi:hypothetical protein
MKTEHIRISVKTKQQLDDLKTKQYKNYSVLIDSLLSKQQYELSQIASLNFIRELNDYYSGPADKVSAFNDYLKAFLKHPVTQHKTFSSQIQSDIRILTRYLDRWLKKVKH